MGAALCLALGSGHGAIVAAAEEMHVEPAGLLTALGFSTKDLRALERGEAISRGMDGSASGEIAVAGAVRVQVPRTYFVDRLMDIVQFKQDDIVLEIGLFTAPPRLEDLETLTLGEDDLRSLAQCRERACDVKLTAPAIATLQAIDWRAADAAERASRAFKAMLLERTERFLAEGADAIEPYADGHSQPFADEVRSLLDASADLFRHAPDFQSSIAAAPRLAAPRIDAVTYWSKEQAAFKPIISLTHMSVFTVESGGATLTYGASVNYYASHYVDASIGATVAVSHEGEPDVVYVVYVNRSRVDALNGAFSGLRRWGVQREARGGLKDRLRDTRRRLEAEYEANPAGTLD